MKFKDKVVKAIEDFNPVAVSRQKRMRARLKADSVSFFTPNCLGGLLFHDLGLQFRSPTVNLMLLQTDFAKFMLDMEAYLKKEFVFFEKQGMNCPCAHLGDITVHFTHYNSPQDAVTKWNSRVKRIDYSNIFIFIEERDGLTKEQIQALGKLPVKGIVAFTAHEYSDIPYAVFLPKYEKDGEIGNILRRNILDNSREYEEYFDFVKWFNEADGAPFDISRFAVKKSPK